jgi:hypothetical protein
VYLPRGSRIYVHVASPVGEIQLRCTAQSCPYHGNRFTYIKEVHPGTGKVEGVDHRLGYTLGDFFTNSFGHPDYDFHL